MCESKSKRKPKKKKKKEKYNALTHKSFEQTALQNKILLGTYNIYHLRKSEIVERAYQIEKSVKFYCLK